MPPILIGGKADFGREICPGEPEAQKQTETRSIERLESEFGIGYGEAKPSIYHPR